MSLGPSTEIDRGLQNPSQRMVSPLSCQLDGSYIYNALISPTIGMTLPQSSEYSPSFHGVEVQPSEACPKNFVVFDQTDERSRVMFHPALTHKYNWPSVDIHRMAAQDNAGENYNDMEDRESSSSMKEDTGDIDALLSSEDESDNDNDEEVSTARTLGTFGSCSPDSCSNYGSKPSKLKFSCAQKSSSGCNSNRSGSSNEWKRQRMRKMVKALRGIVPGADQMNTAAVLDEAVSYLKSLKVEVKKLGIGNFSNSD